jgi:hypothetical protein
MSDYDMATKRSDAKLVMNVGVAIATVGMIGGIVLVPFSGNGAIIFIAAVGFAGLSIMFYGRHHYLKNGGAPN